MSKGNHRVEAGQPIAEAFSATAWNRAQEAADQVLGVTGGMQFDPNKEYSFGLQLPIYLPENDRKQIACGTMIEYQGIQLVTPTDPNLKKIQYLKGRVAKPRTLVSYETQAVGPEQPFCVATHPAKATDEFITCCVKGVCVVAMNYPSVQVTGFKVCGPTIRGNYTPVEGAGEKSDAGFGTIIQNFSTYAVIII